MNQLQMHINPFSTEPAKTGPSKNISLALPSPGKSKLSIRCLFDFRDIPTNHILPTAHNLCILLGSYWHLNFIVVRFDGIMAYAMPINKDDFQNLFGDSDDEDFIDSQIQT